MDKPVAKPTLIVIRGMPLYEGCKGFLLGLVSSTSAQGDVFSVAISPDGLEPFTEVFLPAPVIKVITQRKELED